MSNDAVHIHIDPAEKRDDLPEFEQDAPCPACGGPTETGFGMAGGGFGIYSYCPACAAVTSKSETADG